MTDRRSDDQSVRGALVRRRLALGIAAVVCALGGGTAVTAAVLTDRPAPPQAAGFGDSTPTAAASSVRPATPGRSTRASARPHTSARSSVGPDKQPNRSSLSPSRATDSEPTKINIPAIGVHADFVPLGLTSKGELATPSDPDQVGWFTGGYPPGGPGVAVVAGHVTWNGAEGAFFELADLKHGDRIKINRKDGSTAVFAVRRLATFPKNHFPTEQVYRHSDQPELVLITCGGNYSAAAHYYDANVIAWADLVHS
ncbi:class F sortase [Microlunatus elymi]|uniref:Class F sortase n=1 Tax=Microlunatus elymi TaxID=2596828 RepID=A0A516PUS1_9ACTN|nr:class F sortase [Microlunatus elymi]QDP94893.1 class F sortase [Microlunatus elymi]